MTTTANFIAVMSSEALAECLEKSERDGNTQAARVIRQTLDTRAALERVQAQQAWRRPDAGPIVAEPTASYDPNK
jgi:hypothetical protein